MDIISYWSKEAGIFLGTLIAAFAVSDRIVRVASFLVDRWKKRRIEERLRAILIVPTIEEIAKYSIQSPQTPDPFEPSFIERMAVLKEEDWLRKRREIAQLRLLTLALSFAMAFFVIGARFVSVAYGYH